MQKVTHDQQGLAMEAPLSAGPSSTLSAKSTERECRGCGRRYPIRNEEYNRYMAYCESCRDEAIKEEARRLADEMIIREIPAKYRNLDVDRPERIKLLEDALRKGQGLYIQGGVGTGKTVFAAVFARRLICQGCEVMWRSYPDLIMELQDAYRAEKSSYAIAKAAAEFPGWLILDDLGAEKATDFVRQITYYILNEREQQLRSTVITSNLQLGEIDAAIHPRISSRIAGMCRVVDFGGEDRRVASNKS